jgi:phytoene dehydrogenase-like protein
MKILNKKFFLLCIGLFALLSPVWGCDDDEEEQDNREQESDPEGSHDADAISGATPGVKSMALSKSHDGWGKNDCLSCHDSAHVHNYTIGDCVSCHGRNNSPVRPEPHEDQACAKCHADQHPEMGALPEDSCRACHAIDTASGKTCAYEETYDVAIIGGGGGGLAAAATLASGGRKVLLVEQHYKVGGCMVAFDRGEYRFDASLHAFDGFGLGLLSALGIQDEVTPVVGDVMYQVVYPDFSFEVPSDMSDYQIALKEAFPDEAENIEALFAEFSSMQMGYGELTLLEAVESYGIEDDKLIGLFTALAPFLATTPDEVMANEFVGMWNAFHQMGYYYFEGGSQAITDALESVIVEHGGVIKRHTRASEITLADGVATGIRTADGGCYETSAVISNANAKATYLNLVGEDHLPQDLVDGIGQKNPSPSNLAMIFIGVDRDYTDRFPGGGHEIFVTTDPNHSPANIDDMRCLPEAADFVITNYSVVDPEAAPEGKNAIVITVDYMDYDCNNVWQFDKSYENYEAYKQTLAEVLVERAETLLPELSEHIEVLEVASPKTIEQFILSPRGAWAGWAIGEPEVAFLETTETPIEGLFMAGSWVEGSGQSVALSTGISAATAANEYMNGLPKAH